MTEPVNDPIDEPVDPPESTHDHMFIKISNVKLLKAITSAVLAGLAVLVSFSDVLPGWLMIITAVLIAGLGTFVVPPNSWVAKE